LLTLFSSALEFNNLFASYKGEGTGAVRHMFSHHILKPERMPLEANVWGTPKSSGSFSGLYRTRLLRAIAYRRTPFEVPRPEHPSGRPATRAAVQCSPAFRGEVHTTWPPESCLPARSVHLSCGSSDSTELPEKSVDLVVTDPPFFDNVHYSELADFFLAWQSLLPHGFLRGHFTTRSEREVQDKRANDFALKLGAVFSECHRVLKDDGLLVFTYHHSRPDGWSSLASAICNAGFSIVNAHPVKAEMSVAAPKSQAKEPIQLDVILVCRKRRFDQRSERPGHAALAKALEKAVAKASRLHSCGFALSRNDRRVILYSQFLAELGPTAKADDVLQAMLGQQSSLDAALDESFFCNPAPLGSQATRDSGPQPSQRLLFD
jgi:putative DNA methylase